MCGAWFPCNEEAISEGCITGRTSAEPFPNPPCYPSLRESIFPTAFMTPTSEEGTMGAAAGQEGREMGRNLGRQNESWAARNGARCLGPVQELQARGATKWGGDGLWEAELGTSESWKTGRFLDFAEKKNNVHNYKAQDLAEDSCLSAGMGWREWRSQESEGLSAPCSLHTT